MNPGHPLRPLSPDELQAMLAKRAPILQRHRPDSPYGVADRLEERASQHADRPFLREGDRTLTYGEVDRAANRIARALDRAGIVRGDVVALLIENRCEFVLALFAVLKRGAAVGLINTATQGRALTHAIGATGAKLLLAGDECLGALAWDDLAIPVQAVANPAAPAPAELRARCAGELLGQARDLSDAPPPPDWRAGLKGEDTALLMFTSGTTGLPKAAIGTHMRWLIGGDVKAAMMELDQDDVFYCFLPLFHGAAMISLFASALSVGGTFVIRRRFSASQFWPDVRRYGVTVCQYVGEICRYLMNQPPRADDRDHSLRALTGTSMSPALWPRFQERFGVPQIYEGWGSTEGNTSLVNYENIPGAVGRVLDWQKTNLRIVRYDVDSDTHPRDADGHFILCGTDEPGEAIARISRLPDSDAGRFEGYTSAPETERKILRNVFAEGDQWWRSGDLLRCDADGHVFFVDRIGDTFRWKSENVSTQEVADLLDTLPGLEMIAIYGVRVPGQEGCAGMAALLMQPGARFDPAALYRLATERLAPYAVPLFVRLWSDGDFTASYKLRKVELQRQGYDPAQTGDPLFVLDPAQQTYAPLTPEKLAALGIPAQHA